MVIDQPKTFQRVSVQAGQRVTIIFLLKSNLEIKSTQNLPASDVPVQAGRGVGQGSRHPRHHGRYLQKAGRPPCRNDFNAEFVARQILNLNDHNAVA